MTLDSTGPSDLRLDASPLGWWASVQQLGWSGGKAAELSDAGALDLLVRGVRGRRRRARLLSRVADALGSVAARLESPGAPSPVAARHVLRAVPPDVAAELDSTGRKAVLRLAEYAASPGLLGEYATALSDERLLQLAQVEAGHPAVASLDVELDAAGDLIDIAVVITRRGRRLASRLWKAADPEISEWLAGNIVAAHNGEVHDFPLLDAAGIALPGGQLDTLRWSWIAVPVTKSHRLASLHARFASRPPPEQWHDAMSDALALSDVLHGLIAATNALPGSTRAGLRQALAGAVDESVLDLMLGPPQPGAWVPPPVPATVEWDGRGVPDAARSVITVADLDAWLPPSTSVVVDPDPLRSVTSGGGWLLQGSRVIDRHALASACAGGGWAVAIALRVVEEAEGAVCAWPASARDLLGDRGHVAVPTMEAEQVWWGGGPWATDPESFGVIPAAVPVALLDAVSLLFSGYGHQFVDLEHRAGPVEAVVTHPGPIDAHGGAEIRSLWERVLGGPVQFTGRVAELDLDIVMVSGLSTAGDGLRSTSRIVALAADLSEHRSTVVVTSAARCEVVVERLRSAWRKETGTFLLRPPEWPTVSEASSRLAQEPHLALATAGTAANISAGCDIVIDRPGMPDPSLPVVARLLSDLGKDEDPYGSVIEPIGVLRLLRVLAAVSGSAYVCDPVASSPAVRAALGRGRSLRSIAVEDVPSGSRSALVRRALGESRRSLTAGERGALLDAATRRLLGEHGRLQEFQRTVVTGVLDRHDVLGVFRTGAGKSVCYQSAAMVLAAAGEGVTIVLSPLIALQRDQVEGLRARGIYDAAMLNSELTAPVRAARLRGIRAGYYRLVYAAPEALFGGGLRETLAAASVALVAVDEAHCISEMGHNFRPDYRSIPTAIARLAGLSSGEGFRDAEDRPVLLALTGTASPEVRADIVSQLDGRFRIHVDSAFIRPELHFSVVRVPDEPVSSAGEEEEVRRPDRWARLLDELHRSRLPGIVYVATRKEAESLARSLCDAGFPSASPYHAGLEPADRRRTEEGFRSGAIDLVVATNAFGMGIDKDDIRTVVHWRLPGSPEALYQEAGRAGRGERGRPGFCTALFHPSDLDLASRIERQSVPTRAELERVLASLGELADLQHANGGRDVLVEDGDLARLSGLREDIDPGVCLAHLARVGLVEEVGRVGRAWVVRRLGSPNGVLPPVEAELYRRISRGGGVVSPNVVRDALAAQGVIVGLGELRRGIDQLAHAGLVEVDRAPMRFRLLTAQPAHDAERRSTRAVALLDQIAESDRWVVPTVTKNLPLPAIQMCLEALAGLGAIRVSHQNPSRPLPAVMAVRARVPHARKVLGMAAPAIEHLLQASASDVTPDLDRELGLDPADASAVLAVTHALGVISLDPMSWKEGGVGAGANRSRASTVRQLRVARDSPDERLDAAESAAISLAHRDRLRRRALYLYGTALADQSAANISPAGDSSSVDIFQRYLEDYFTRPGFLDDLAAAESENILRDLDAEQRAAVECTDRVLGVRAGAGSGKTRTITRRIAHRIARGDLFADQILAVCFTRAAVAEMSSRLAELGVSGVRVGTLNSVGRQLVSSYWPSLGLRGEPALLDDREREAIVGRLLQAGTGDGSEHSGRVLKEIDLARYACVGPAEYPTWAEDGRSSRSRRGLPSAASIAEVYSAYLELLRSSDQIDFLGQIELAIEALSDSAVQDNERLRTRHVVVDEAQDLAPVEWRFVDRVVGRGELSFVGDPRQAIYEWRGADPSEFDRRFDHPSTTRVDLRRNYRSSPEVVARANKVMRGYPPMEAVDRRAGLVEISHHDGDSEHPAEVVAQVRAWIDQGIADDEIAVLARRGDEVGSLVSALRAAQIACHGVGVQPLTRTTTFRLLDRYLSGEARDEADGGGVLGLLERLRERDEIRAQVEHEVDVGAEADSDPFTDWLRLEVAVADLERGGPLTWADVVKRLRRDDADAVDSGVTVATVHKAKGLEWDAVAIPFLSGDGFGPADEDRRVLYVAVTRARRHLRGLTTRAVAGGTWTPTRTRVARHPG